MSWEQIRAITLFDGISDENLRELVDVSDVVQYEPGDVLWQAGAPSDYWWVNITGSIDMVRVSGGEESVVGQLSEPGRWAGGFGAWDEHAAYFGTGRASTAGTLLRVPNPALRDLLAHLPLVSHLISGVFTTARSIEAGARQRESLVRLGTLSAGLAHELNNPAAATARAVVALESQLDDALASLSSLATHGISADQYQALDGLRRQLLANEPVGDALALADREEEIGDWLSDHGVDRDWVLAPALAAAGADQEWCTQALGLMGDGSLQHGMEWVAATLTVRGLLAEVRESTRRISELVGSVKSYTQMDRAVMQSIDVTEGLDSTVTMLAHKIRDGVTVERSFAPDVPLIDAYPGELNQVWTNLIDNALDAMDGSGRLMLTTRSAADSVVVEIADTGSGMTPEVAARAFETFFTTKEVGKGTGLGLDIARRIVVERHGGHIDIDSHPGATTIRVTLPLTPAAPR